MSDAAFRERLTPQHEIAIADRAIRDRHLGTRRDQTHHDKDCVADRAVLLHEVRALRSQLAEVRAAIDAELPFVSAGSWYNYTVAVDKMQEAVRSAIPPPHQRQGEGMSESQEPLLSDEQLAALERQIAAAEREILAQMHKSEIKTGPAQEKIQFHAIPYLRRLLNDLNHYRAITKAVARF